MAWLRTGFIPMDGSMTPAPEKAETVRELFERIGRDPTEDLRKALVDRNPIEDLRKSLVDRPHFDVDGLMPDAMRRLRETMTVAEPVRHTAPDIASIVARISAVPNPVNDLVALAEASKASVLCQTLLEQFDQVDAALDPSREVAVALTHLGVAMTVHVHGLEYSDPSLIFLIGENEHGEPVRLVQSVATLNFAIVTRPRLHPEEPKREFGFAQAVPRTQSGVTVSVDESPPAP